MLELHGSPTSAMKALSAQFAVIQSRTQLLLTLATLTLTITGFSGPRIAVSGAFARAAMICGLVLVLMGVVAALVGSLRIRWLTQFIGANPHEELAAIIAYRNRKTAWFVWELLLVVGGLSCYVAAVIAYLSTTPIADSLPRT